MKFAQFQKTFIKGGLTFSKLMEAGGGGGSKNCGQKGGGEAKLQLSYYVAVFLEIPHDAAQETNVDVFIFPLLTNMCYKILALALILAL